MSYLGSSATPIPVAFSGVRTQSFSGNGSTSLFTLNRAVTAVTDIEVIVNNVQQSPFDGSYSLSNNGLGLQFSENVSAGTNNIYVIYRDQPMGSLIDPGAVRLTGDQGIAGVKTFAGNTGFGTTSPLDVVHVAKAGGTGNGGRVRIQNSGVRQWSIGTIDANFTIKDETGATEPFKIDAAGRLTVPNQVAFCGAQSLSLLSGGIINWNVSRLNKGGHLNLSTGKFTAPIAGMYFFSANIISGSTGACSCDILVNGATYSAGYTQYDLYNTTSTTLAVELSAGDWVAVSSSGTFYAGIYYGAFTGFLIG